MLGVFQQWASQEPPFLASLESAFQNPSVIAGGPSVVLGSGVSRAWPWSSAPPAQRLASPLPRAPLGLGPVQAPEKRENPGFGISDLIPALALPLPFQGDLGSVGSLGWQRPHP